MKFLFLFALILVFMINGTVIAGDQNGPVYAEIVEVVPQYSYRVEHRSHKVCPNHYSYRSHYYNHHRHDYYSIPRYIIHHYEYNQCHYTRTSVNVRYVNGYTIHYEYRDIHGAIHSRYYPKHKYIKIYLP